MSYLDSHLMDGEEVVYRTRLHPIVFLGPLLGVLLGGYLAVEGNALVQTHVLSKIPREILRTLPPHTLHWLREGWHGYNIVGLFILVFNGALPLLSRVMNVASSEFGVSTKRVLMKTGFISRHSLETLLSKVESISVYQGMMGRLFGFGSIIISGTGGSKEFFFGIRDPMEFRRQVQEQISKAEKNA